MDFLGSGPIFKTDSNNERPAFLQSEAVDSESRYNQAVSTWREQTRQEAYETASLNPEFNAIQKYINSLSGQWWDKRRAKYKSAFFDNRLEHCRISDLAALTDTRPTIDVKTQIEAYKQQTSIVGSVIRYEWMRNDMDLSLVSVADIARLMGTGFWKIGAAAPGYTQVVPCGTDNVMPIQPGFHIQQSSAVMYRTWKSLAWFKNRFPWAANGLERELSDIDQSSGGPGQYSRPSNIDEYTWNGLSPQMRRIVGVKVDSSAGTVSTIYKSLELQEFYVDDPQTNDSSRPVLMRHPYVSLEGHNWWYWVKPGERLYPRKRLLVFAGRRLMYDGPNWAWHGLYPFACLRLNPVPWSFWGLSKYRDLIPINTAINEIVAGILDMCKRALNPTALTKSGAVPPASWKEFFPDMPGQKLYMGPNANIADLRYMQPPEIPAYVFNLLVHLSGEFDRLAGSVDTSALKGKKQVPGADSIEAMRDMQSAGMRLEGRYLEAFLRDSGVQAMSNTFQFYEMTTLMQMLGEMGIDPRMFNDMGPNLIPDKMPKEDHWRNFSIEVMPGSLHGGAKDRNRQIAIAMASKDLFPILDLYKILELPNPEGLIAQLKKERDEGLGSQGRKASRTGRAERTGGV